MIGLTGGKQVKSYSHNNIYPTFIKEKSTYYSGILTIGKMDALVLDKERIMEMLCEFPQNVIIEDFIDRIIITAKIEKALDQFENGEYMTSEELDEEIKKWD